MRTVPRPDHFDGGCWWSFELLSQCTEHSVGDLCLLRRLVRAYPTMRACRL